MDGAQEWLFQDARINCYVQSTGGGVFELDYLPKVWNYLATSGGRQTFADRLLPSSFKAENLENGAIDGARLCYGERYDLAELDKIRRKLRLALRQKTTFPFGGIEIEKTYSLKKDSVVVGYSLNNSGTAQETFQFAPEIDLALPGEGKMFTRFFACRAEQADATIKADALNQLLLRGADGLKIHDIKNEVQIVLAANRPFNGKISPVYLTDEASGAEMYQAYCVMPLFPVTLEACEKWEIEFTLKFSH
jgi:hypothetical protein